MKKPRSLRIRYTLRALLVFITLFMVWGGYHTNRGWKERVAEDLLTKRGASCQYAKQTIEGDFVQRVAAVYGRVVQFLWRERAVTYVSLDAPLDAEVVEALASLPHLKSLWISPELPTAEQRQLMKDGKALKPKEAVPNDALERILGACPLQHLAISGWTLTDEVCQSISAKAGLNYLSIDGSGFSEHGFALLISKPGLTYFSFRYCDVTGDLLTGCAGSPSLERVTCGTAPVSSALAEFVSRSPNVKELVAKTENGDEFLHALGQHGALSTLGLGGTNFSDASTANLAQMPALVYVALPKDRITTEGLARLQRVNPRLRISPY